MSNVHHLPVFNPKPMARRAKLSEEVLRTIGYDERVNDIAEPGFFALGLKGGKVSLKVKADVPEALRRWNFGRGRSVERLVGVWPDEISPKAARPVAKSFIADIRRGIDPRPKIRTRRSQAGQSSKPSTNTLSPTWLARECPSRASAPMNTISNAFLRVGGSVRSAR